MSQEPHARMVFWGRTPAEWLSKSWAGLGIVCGFVAGAVLALMLDVPTPIAIVVGGGVGAFLGWVLFGALGDSVSRATRRADP